MSLKDVLEFKKDEYVNIYRAKIFYDNWYWASIIYWFSTYSTENTYELAVLIWNADSWELCYDTHITDDVLWHLTEQDVLDTLELIQAL